MIFQVYSFYLLDYLIIQFYLLQSSLMTSFIFHTELTEFIGSASWNGIISANFLSAEKNSGNENYWDYFHGLNSVTVDSEMMKNWDPEVSNHILFFFWWKLLRTVGNVWRQKLSQNFGRAMHTSCPLGGFWANVMPFWLDKALFDRKKFEAYWLHHFWCHSFEKLPIQMF